MVFDGLRRQVEDLRSLLGDRDYLVAWRFEQALKYARSAFTAYLESEVEDPFDDTTIALAEKTQQKVARVRDAIPLLSAAPEKVAGLLSSVDSLVHTLEVRLEQYLQRDPISITSVSEPLRVGLDVLSAPSFQQLSPETKQIVTSFFALIREIQAHLVSYEREERLDSSSSAVFLEEETISQLFAEMSATLASLNRGLKHDIEETQRRAFESSMRERRWLFIATGMALLVILVVSVHLGKYLTRRVSALVTGTHRFAEGQLAYRVPDTTDDQIGGLAQSFNAMADTLQKQEMKLKNSVRALRESRERLSQTQRISKLGHCVWDLRTRRALFSEALRSILRLPAGPAGLTYNEFLALVHPRDREKVQRRMDDAFQRAIPFSLDHRMGTPDEAERIVHQETVVDKDANGKPKRVIATIQDVTDRKRAEREIRKLAYFDSVTGLPNRPLMEVLLAQAIASAKRNGRHVALLFLDLDHFKNINDTSGHTVGDKVLHDMAERLQISLRHSDSLARPNPEASDIVAAHAGSNTVARLGGDEFLIVLNDVVRAEDAAIVCERIREAMFLPFQVAHSRMTLSASIGIAVYPTDGDNPETLLKHADAAMYHAKELGRNGYQYFTEGIHVRVEKRMSMEGELRHVIEAGELLLHYQPKLDLRSGRFVGAEALVRWAHPEKGLISPGELIPLAEDTGLIVPMGDWVLRAACEQVLAWDKVGLGPIQVAVNLSARQFKTEGYMARIERLLREVGLEPHRLELELTEGMLMEDTEKSLGAMHQLRKLGVRVSIDDFGTGYSSLAYLKRFPVTALKIDQSFVQDINSADAESAIVDSIIALAHGLHLEVVAEGVETVEQLQYLQRRGCEVAQGYLLSRPLTVDALAEWLPEQDRDREPSLNHTFEATHLLAAQGDSTS